MKVFQALGMGPGCGGRFGQWCSGGEGSARLNGLLDFSSRVHEVASVTTLATAWAEPSREAMATTARVDLGSSASSAENPYTPPLGPRSEIQEYSPDLASNDIARRARSPIVE